MYCLYRLADTISHNQVFADIVGVLTGTITSPSQFSASCNQASTTLITSTPAGWSLYDNAAGAPFSAGTSTPVVLRAPYTDDPTKFKNVYLSHSSTGVINIIGHDTWNATTHTGTGKLHASALNAAGGWSSCVWAAGGYLIISASIAHLFIQRNSLSTTPDFVHVMVSEYTRDDLWNTVAAGYPSWLITGSSTGVTTSNGYIPKVYDTVSGLDVSVWNGAPAGITSTTEFGFTTVIRNAQTTFGPGICTVITNSGPLSKQAANENRVAMTYLYPIQVRQSTYIAGTYKGLWLGGDLSAKNQTMYYTRTRGATLDEMQVGSDVYVITHVDNSGASTCAIKKS